MSSQPDSSGAAPGDAWDYAAIRDCLTVERLGSYLDAASGDTAGAFRLYEWNMRASAGVMTLTGMIEVIVRNSFDQQLRTWARRRPGAPSWFDEAPLDEQGRNDVSKARHRATRYGRNPEVHGKVVAELTFGFWRYLAASRYLTSLWVPATSGAFPLGAVDLRVRRSEVEDRLQRLAFVRNRAAHHEPIHRRDLRRDLVAAVELARWISTDAAAWVAAKSPIDDLLSERPQFASAQHPRLR